MLEANRPRLELGLSKGASLFSPLGSKGLSPLVPVNTQPIVLGGLQEVPEPALYDCRGEALALSDCRGEVPAHSPSPSP